MVVKARNSVVVAETERALLEGCHKIMILYGGLHMQVGGGVMNTWQALARWRAHASAVLLHYFSMNACALWTECV